MAERISGLSINLDMDTAGLSRSMTNIKDSFRDIKRSAQVNLNNIKFDRKNIDSYKKNIDELSKSFNNQKKNVDDLKSHYDKMVAVHGEGSKEAQAARIEYNKQADELNKLGHALDGATNELKELEEQQRIASSGWTKMGESAEKSGQKLQTIGGGMQVAGGKLTKFSALAIGSVTGLGAGLFALTDKATEAADGIAKGAEKIGTSTDFYQEATYWASQNGLAQEDMEKAVGRLNQRMGLAVDGNKKYAGALEKLGVDLNGVKDGTVSTEDAMAQSLTTLSGMENQHEKAALAAELFGTKLSREMMPALNDGSLTMEEARKKAEELGLVMGQDQLEAAEAFQDAKDDIVRSAGAIGMKIGLDLMPHFQRLLDWVRSNMPMIREKIMTAFNAVVDSVKNLSNWWTELSGTSQNLILGFGALALSLGPVLLFVGKVASGIGGLMMVLGPLVTKVGAAGGMMKVLGTAFAAITGPVGLTIAGIAALGTGFVIAYNKSETFRNFIDGLKGKFVGAWQKAIEFKDKVITAISGIKSFFTGDTEGGIKLLQSIGLSDETIEKVWVSVGKIRKSFFEMKFKINEALAGVKTFFISMFTDIKDWWDTDGTLIFSAIKTTVSTALTFVVDLFNRFKPIVLGIWNAIFPVMHFIIKMVWEKIKLVVGIGMDVIQGIISGVSALIEGDWSRFGQILKDTALSIWNRVTEFFGNMKNNALELFNKLTGGAVTKFLELKDKVIGKVIAMKDGVVNKFTALKDGAINRITSTYNSVTGKFESLKSSVSTKASNLKNNVTSRFTELKDNSIGRVKSAYTGVTGWFGDIKSSVSTTVTNIKDDTVGKFTGMKDGAIDGVQKLYNGASGLFDDVKDYAEDTFQNMVDGAKELPGKLGDAIKNGASKAVDGVKSLGNKMTGKLGSVVNGVIGGLNSITGKIGITSTISKWNVPTFSTGTGQGSPSGKLTKNGKIAMDTMATVGDKGKGNGSGTRELVRYPNGKVGLYDNDATIFAPKGTTIFSNKETESMLGQIPKFSEGTGLWGSIKQLAGKAVDYITNPKKIFDDLISLVGDSFGDMSGFAGNFIKGAWSMIKDGMFGWIKDKFSEASVGKSQKWMDYKMTTPYSPNAPVPGYPTSFNGGRHYGIDYGTPTGVNITAPMAGTVSRMSDRGGGNVARLKAGGNAAQYFMHMNSVKTGKVGIGDSVGKSGNTGEWTTGPHVHWQHEDPSASYVQNRNTKNPLSMIKGHLKGGQILSDGLFNLHKGEYVINPNEPTEAMKLLAIVGKKLAGKSKQTREVASVGNIGSENSVMHELLDATLKQNQILMKLLNKDTNVYMDSQQVGSIIDEHNAVNASLQMF